MRPLLLTAVFCGFAARAAGQEADVYPKLGLETRRNKLLDGKLPTFWARDSSGIDLAVDWIRRTGRTLHPLKLFTLETLDPASFPGRVERHDDAESELGASLHGDAVASFLLAPPPFGYAPHATYDYFAKCEAECLAKRTADFLRGKLHFYSASKTHDEAQTAWLAELGRQNIPIYVSAGNYFPDLGSTPSSYPPRVDQIGELSALGWPKATSTSPNEVTLLGAGEYPYAIQGFFEIFGGTSGAQPHVAACASLLKGLRPELDGAGLRDLLTRTGFAIRTSAGREYRSLNCYRAVRAAVADPPPLPKTASLRERYFAGTGDPEAFIREIESRRGFLASAIYRSFRGYRAEELKRIEREIAGSPLEADFVRLVAETNALTPERVTRYLNSTEAHASLLVLHYAGRDVPVTEQRRTFERHLLAARIDPFNYHDYLALVGRHYDRESRVRFCTQNATAIERVYEAQIFCRGE